MSGGVRGGAGDPLSLLNSLEHDPLPTPAWSTAHPFAFTQHAGELTQAKPGGSDLSTALEMQAEYGENRPDVHLLRLSRNRPLVSTVSRPATSSIGGRYPLLRGRRAGHPPRRASHHQCPLNASRMDLLRPRSFQPPPASQQPSAPASVSARALRSPRPR